VRKSRLDTLIVERELAPSRARAQALILAGRVLVDEQKVEKPGTAIRPDAVLRMLGGAQRYVSRGGEKLEAALAHWKIDLEGRRCADIGASTGGFTDCMLQHGAAHVTAVDTGYGQIAQSIRNDSRVTLLERTNARRMKPGSLSGGISFVAMDVAFISATLVLPAVLAAITQTAEGVPQAGGAAEPDRSGAGVEAVILVKPQFEAGREHVGKGGIVRDPAAHQLAIDRVRTAAAALGASGIGLLPSPILGAEGNREFLLHARFSPRDAFPVAGSVPVHPSE
jgi:23S rRNA (cytidine1920-2'-O)/16S rRNA (cytidine1409-2'-O)-methyltransferase